jgi:hypothetical protein
MKTAQRLYNKRIQDEVKARRLQERERKKEEKDAKAEERCLEKERKQQQHDAATLQKSRNTHKKASQATSRGAIKKIVVVVVQRPVQVVVLLNLRRHCLLPKSPRAAAKSRFHINTNNNVPHRRVGHLGELATPTTHQKAKLLHLIISTTT